MKTLIAIKTDKQLKEKAQRVASDLGFPLGTLLNAYMRQLVRMKSVQFTSGHTLVPTPFLEEILDAAAEDIAHDRLSARFSNAADAIAHLRKI